MWFSKRFKMIIYNKPIKWSTLIDATNYFPIFSKSNTYTPKFLTKLSINNELSGRNVPRPRHKNTSYVFGYLLWLIICAHNFSCSQKSSSRLNRLEVTNLLFSIWEGLISVDFINHPLQPPRRSFELSNRIINNFYFTLLQHYWNTVHLLLINYYHTYSYTQTDAYFY